MLLEFFVPVFIYIILSVLFDCGLWSSAAHGRCGYMRTPSYLVKYCAHTTGV